MKGETTGVPPGSVEHLLEPGTCRVRYVRDAIPAGTAVVPALSDVPDATSGEAQPLSATVDPGPLDASVRGSERPNGDGDVTVTMDEPGRPVSSTGLVVVAPPSHERPADRDTGITPG